MQPGLALTQIALLALLLMPALVLVVRHSSNACLFVLVLLALIHFGRQLLDRRRARPDATPLGADYRLFMWALAAYPLYTFLRLIAVADYNGHALEPTLRYLLAVPAFWLIARIDAHRLRGIAFGYTAGAIASAVVAWLAIHQMGLPRGTQPFINAIPFGNMALVLGYIALLATQWSTRQRWPLTLLGVVGLGGGIYASLLSESRGGWVTLPLFLLAALGGARRLGRGLRIGAIALALALGAASYVGSDIVRNRVEMLQSDFAKLEQGDEATSTGIRLALWRAALSMGAEHPLFGVGKGRWQPTLVEYAHDGRIAPTLTDKRHAHNDLLNHFAETGLIGALLLLGIYLVPGRVFVRRVHSGDALLAGASRAGLLVCACYFVFGLTESMLAVSMNTAFHAMTLIWLMAIVARRETELAAGSVLAAVGATTAPRRRFKQLLIPVRIAIARALWWQPARPARIEPPTGPMVFIRWDGKLGDFVVSSFIYGALKRRHGCEIVTVVAPGQEAMYEETDGVDRAFGCQRKRPLDIWRTGLALRRLKPHYCVELTNRARWSDLLLMRLAGARINLKGMAPAFNLFQLLDLPQDGHMTARYHAFLARFDADPADWRFDWRLPESARDAAARALPQTGRSIIVNPFGASPSRRMTPAGAVDLARQLASATGRDAALLIAPGNDAWAAVAAQQPGARLLRVASIEDSAALIERAGLVVSPDTSIVHIAALYRVPVVTLYPAGPIEVELWRPATDAAELLIARDDPALGDVAGVASIPSADIVAAARRLLAPHPESPTPCPRSVS